MKKFKLRKLTPIQKLMKARVILLKERPFFGTLVLHLRFIEADTEFLKKLIPTMGIDKWGRLFFSPDFVDSLNLDELLAVICHEVHHAVLLHLDRKMSRDDQLWNISADLVINDILVQNKFKLGDGWLHEEKYRDWYVEEIYEELLRKAREQIDKMQQGQIDIHIYQDVDNQNGQGEGECDNCKGTGKDPKTQQECQKCNGTGKQQKGKGEQKIGHGFTPGDEKEIPQWDKVLREAYTYAKQQGKEPLGMERMLDGLMQSQVPWQSIVRKFIDATLPKDYTYFKPHKRSQLQGFYVPSLKREHIDVCVGIDTSGSVSDEEYMEFVSELVGLDRVYKNRINFHIVTCDAAIHSVQDFGHGFDPRKLKSRGYGGTMFQPVFDHVKENVPKAKLLIYFTDLFGDQDHLEKAKYNFHTLWVLTSSANNDDPPFGTWVRLQEKRQTGKRFATPY